MAKAIHHKSRRNSELFITVHCDQSEERLEYELFGAEGALNRASRGTLFLYEIGDMPLSVQARLLSELDAGLSARIIASKTADLGDTGAENTFSQDLFYRLHVLCLPLPALSERKSDIPLLLQRYADSHGASMFISIRPFIRCLSGTPLTATSGNFKMRRTIWPRQDPASTIYPDDVPLYIKNSQKAKTAKKKKNG